MNPKEGLKALVRNPWVQKGVLITTVLLSSGACIPRPETRLTPPPAPTVPAQPKEIPTQFVPTPQPTPTEIPIIAVYALKPDNLTGIEVKRGEILVFQASGTWCMGFGDCGGPDGIRYPAPDEPGIILPKEKIGTLLGAIKTKESPDGRIIFTIGSSREVQVEADGSLILLMNERAGYYRDNSGGLAVRIGKGKGSLGLVQRPQPTPEKAVEQGWVKFRSLNYPYEISYPAGWTTGQQVLGGKKVDAFLGETVGQFQTNVNILAEPVNPWVKLEDYQWQIVEQLNKLIFQTGRGVGVGGGKAKVAGQDAWILNARIPKGAVFFNPDYDILSAVFLARGQGWQITLSTNPSVTQVEQAKFQKMLSSFKFLQ